MVRATLGKQKRWVVSMLAFATLVTTGTVSHGGAEGRADHSLQAEEDEVTFSSRKDAATTTESIRTADWQVLFSPRDNTSEVPVDSVIVIAFQKPVRLTNKKELSDSAIEKIIKLSNAKNRKVAFTSKWDSTTRTIKIKPIGNLENDMAYTISLIGNKLIDSNDRKNPQVTSRFGTKKQEDRIPPTATITPAHGATNVKLDEKIIVQFAEDIVLPNGTSLNSKAIANLVQLFDEKGASVAHSATWNKSKRTITLKVKGKLLKNTVYTTYLPANRVKDTAGNVNQAFSASFTTRSK